MIDLIDIISPMVKDFLPFAKERMGFAKPPKLFLKGDAKNANNPLGRTAFYDPQQQSITLYITGRHPKDIMRSLSHELVHHSQNCRGDFDNVGEMGEGYAQSDDHLREMEREAYEVGNMCFRDWEDGIKSTIYYEHLQKGDKSSMSTKDWKNGELTTILSEAFGFKFNLDRLNEGSDQDGEEGAEEDVEGKASGYNADKDSLEENDEQVFAPNHYCVHHGGVAHNGSVHMAEAVGHNYDESLGRVTHYTMKLKDGTVLENVSAEDIQVTEASMAEGHSHPMGKRDTGASAGDDSKTHPGEKDYSTKKDDDLKDDEDGGSRGEKKGDKAYVNEESGEEEGHHYDDNRMSDDEHIKAIEHHLDALRKDRDYDDDHIDERATSTQHAKPGRRHTQDDGQRITAESAISEARLREIIKQVIKGQE